MQSDNAAVIDRIQRLNGTGNPYEEVFVRMREPLRRCFRSGYSVLEELVTPLPVERLRAYREIRDSNLDAAVEGIVGHAKENGVKVGCAKGCHVCCFQHVLLSTVELMMTIDHLLTAAVPAEHDRIMDRVQRFAPRIASMTRAQRNTAAIPCPALGPGGLCGIYDARPEACRSYLSRSRTACEVAWRKRHRPESLVRGVPIFAEAQAFGHVMLAGLGVAFLEAGFESEHVEMTEGLAHAAALPGGLAGTLDRWLAGEQDQFVSIAAPRISGITYAEFLRLEQRQWM